MRVIFSLIFICLSWFSYGQKEATYWYFGINAGLDFSTNPPTALSNGQLSTEEGCSTISDENGNLLFYSDGIKVFNKNHELMKYSNGNLANNLEGNPSSTQSALVVPNPVNKNIYYLFTVGTDYVSRITDVINPGFNYYTIDISKNNNLGEIIAGPINLANGRDRLWSEKVTAVQGKDCESIWILSMVQNEFYAYEITSTGVNTTPVTSIVNYTLQDKRGYLKVSPDGTKLALADFTMSNQGIGNGIVVLFDFDIISGTISPNYQALTSPNEHGIPYGIEFSRTSKKLYASTFLNNRNRIYQFDLTSNNIANSISLINQQGGYRSGLQLSIDGNIYVSIPGRQSLDIIKNPDNDAANVSYVINGINLGAGTTSQGLPPFVQSFFAPVDIVNTTNNEIISNEKQQFCIGNSYTIQPQVTEPDYIYQWSKNGTVISTDKEITITAENYGSGIYQLNIKSSSSCNKTYTGSVEVEFFSKPQLNQLPTYQQCDVDDNGLDGFTTFNLESKESELIDDLTNISIDFFEESDTNFSSPISNKAAYINTQSINQTLIVKATNTLSGCYDTVELKLKVLPSSNGLTSYKNMYECQIDLNESDEAASSSNIINQAYFDFEIKIDEIINESNNVFTRNNNNFSFYPTKEDAQLEKNEIQAPYNQTLYESNTDIYVRISDKLDDSCKGIGHFKLITNEAPTPNGTVLPVILCLNNPIDTPQLRTITLDGSTGNQNDTYQWYFNNTEITNATNSYYNSNREGFFKVKATRLYFNNVGANDDRSCSAFNSFNVNTSNKAKFLTINLTDDQDNPEDNTIHITVSGIGNFEYALVNTSTENYVTGQENLTYTFEGIEPQPLTIRVRDKNGCGTTESEQYYPIYFQRHFSPNGDGKADTWKIQGALNQYFPTIQVKIFDRQGKIVANINQKNDIGWDGKFNNGYMPSTDYWYHAFLIDINGNTRKKTGHFSLIRE